MMIEGAVPSINETIKMIALNLFETLQPSDVMFGEVIATNPLEIMIDQKNIIPAQYLVLILLRSMQLRSPNHTANSFRRLCLPKIY